MPMTEQDARALAYLAGRLREETHGAGKWDAPGIWAEVSALVGQNLAVTIERVSRHAADPAAKTPGAIRRPFTPGAATAAPTREPYDRATFCGICSEPRDRCERKWDDHEFVPAAKLRAETTRPAETTHAAVAALKADIAPAAPTRAPSAPSHAPRGETTEEEA